MLGAPPISVRIRWARLARRTALPGSSSASASSEWVSEGDGGSDIGMGSLGQAKRLAKVSACLGHVTGPQCDDAKREVIEGRGITVAGSLGDGDGLSGQPVGLLVIAQPKRGE
jgi:hypothetical protein